MSLTTIAFLALVAGGALLAFTRHPIFGLLTYVAVFYLSPADRWWGQDALLEVRWSLSAAAVTLVAIVVHGRRGLKRPFPSRTLLVGLLLFCAWLGIQSQWALEKELHAELTAMYLKFIVTLYMVYRCVDSERHLRWFLTAHLLGCFYFGWMAYTSYEGGRFEGFGGPGLDDANAGALAMATGLMGGAALLLTEKAYRKGALVLAMAFVLNGIVATISRSGFLAIISGGALFNLYTPAVRRRIVRILSVLGVALLALLATGAYWDRIASIKYAGKQSEVVGVDTGGGRKEILIAQTRMFAQHPLGCGHRCTATLSPEYLDVKFLERATGRRSSHNTAMTLLVEHGVPGAVAYLAMVIWVMRRVRATWRDCRRSQSTAATLLPGIVAGLGAIFIGDLFVDYLKFEIRWWFIGLLLALATIMRAPAPDGAGAQASTAAPAAGSAPAAPR
jgi:O-antigen ligase